MLRLEVIEGADVGLVLESAATPLHVGRGEENDLSIASRHISTRHASIALGEGGYVLRDDGSTNGTSVRSGDQEAMLEAGGQGQIVLVHGDIIVLGAGEHAVKVRVGIARHSANIVSVRGLSDLENVEAEVRKDSNLLQDLYDAQRALAAASDLNEVINVVAQSTFQFLERATHVTVALREEDATAGAAGGGRYVPVASRVRNGGGTEPVPITRSVFRKVVEKRAAVLAADAKEDVGQTASIMAAKILSTIGVPLWQADELVGVLQVDNRDAAGIFREADLDILALLGQAASQAFVKARLIGRLRLAEERQRNENEYLKRREESRRFDGIIGESSAMKDVFSKLRKVVDTRVSILIEGETGTGKELIASAAHYWSNRKDGLFVAQNCAALPENLLESELFGHRKGAFTGATDDKKGLFELAHGGTLFLDEVGEMPLGLQAKLLRVLQEGEVRPVGASTPKRVDVRIVAATNRKLEEEVSAGRFREDLFYRLNVFPILLPPLRERREDIPLIAAHFVEKYAQEFGREARGFAQETLETLQGYRWPGNVRELENEVQRVLIQIEDGEFIGPQHLTPRLRHTDNVVAQVRPTKGTLKNMMATVEAHILSEALREHNGNKTATAKSLDITREGLHKKLKRHGL